MAFQFPINPLVGDVFTPVSGTSYTWNGTGWAPYVSAGTVFPSGVMMPWAGAGTSLPDAGWLLCDGDSVLVADYPALFAVIGYTYGGAGPNFSMPDLRGRVIAGLDDMGGSAASRLTLAVAGFDPTVLGAAGGAQEVALTTANLASHNHAITDVTHTHTITDPTHAHGVTDPGHSHGAEMQTSGLDLFNGLALIPSQFGNTQTAVTGLTVSAAYTGVSAVAAFSGLTGTSSAGSGTAHLNVQPTMTMNWIIKT